MDARRPSIASPAASLNVVMGERVEICYQSSKMCSKSSFISVERLKIFDWCIVCLYTMHHNDDCIVHTLTFTIKSNQIKYIYNAANFRTNGPTDVPTDKAIVGVGRGYTLPSDYPGSFLLWSRNVQKCIFFC